MTDFTSQIERRAPAVSARHMRSVFAKVGLLSLIVALVAYPVVNGPKFHPGGEFGGSFAVDRTEFPLAPGVSYNVTAAHQHYVAVKGLPWILQVSWDVPAR